jgi:hypothetical protein
MAVSFAKIRKLIHRKSPEMVASLAAGNTAAGGFVVSDKSNLIPGHDATFYVGGASVVWRYNADEDGWMPVPNSGIAGTFGNGSCGEFRILGAPGGVFTQTATGGSTTTINTALTITRSLAGQRIRVVNGAGVGYSGTILYNTTGANAILTVSIASAVAFTSTTQFQLLTGSLWFFNGGTGAVGFSVYDIATNAWTARSVAGIPTTWNTDAQLVSTGGVASNEGAGFVNGTATSGGASALTDGTKNWPVNGWANSQVRIVTGTGAGQIRVIASNTATVLTVSSAWTVQPDATSVYVIEGNDDVFYLMGNNAVTMYRFSVSGNAWTTLAPAAARAGAAASGATLDWVDNVTSWSESSPGVYGNHVTTTVIRQLGRYLYSMRGGGTSTLDIYDIAANTWISGVAYGGQMETFNAGSHSVDINGRIFIQKEATGRVYAFDIAGHDIDPLYLSPMPQAAAVTGDKMFVQTLNDGADTGRWLYLLGHSRSEMTRIFLV